LRHAFAGAAALLAACLAAGDARSTTVYVVSVGRTDVQLVVNAAAYRLKAGESSPEGVRVSEIRGGTVVLEVDGKRLAMTLGQSTMAHTELKADTQGHFFTTAYINGVAVSALIDTGATSVAMTRELAARLGVATSGGRRIAAQTANGIVQGTSVTIGRVQLGNIVLTNVEGSILEGAQQMPMVLIGMSFLKQVELRRSGDTLILTRPHY
jgi:aspartyl protease family protein